MILPGIIKLAYGNAKGIDEFSDAPESFAASLAPLIAFPLVGAVITGSSGSWKLALLAFVSRLCAVLVLPAIIYEFSRLYKRQGQWVRTATALNWCYWLVLPAIMVAAVLGSVAVQFGVPMPHAEIAVLAAAGFYLLWNRWFVLKTGLKLNGWRVVPIILASLFFEFVFSALPLLVGLKLMGVPLPTSS